LEEYWAGTSPNDPASLFRIDLLSPAVGGLGPIVLFNAASNHTYTVQSREGLGAGSWSNVADVLAVASNRVVAVTNQLPVGSHRFYRVTTPASP